MPACSICIQHDISRRLFPKRNRSDARDFSAFIKKAAQFNTAFLKIRRCQRGTFYIFCSKNLFIVSQGDIKIEAGPESLPEQFFCRFHQEQQHCLAVNRSPAPDTPLCQLPAERRIYPFSFFPGRNHILMRHKKYRFFTRIFCLPMKQQAAVADHNPLHVPMQQRIGFFQKGTEPVNRFPVRSAVIFC